jgi:hypothetical protein
MAVDGQRQQKAQYLLAENAVKKLIATYLGSVGFGFNAPSCIAICIFSARFSSSSFVCLAKSVSANLDSGAVPR